MLIYSAYTTIEQQAIAINLSIPQSGVSQQLQALSECKNHEIEVVQTLLKSLKLEAYCNETYYISSIQTSAEQWQPLIQGHWGIENRLHWPKDVLFDEDKTRLEDPQSLLVWSIIRSFVINILRLKGYQSLKPTLTKLAHRLDLIFSLLQ